MKCREVRQLVYLYREGDVSEEIRREVLQHAGSCQRCAYELRQAGSVGLSVADLREAEPQLYAGRDFTEQIMRGVESARMNESRHPAPAAARSLRRVQIACTMAAAAIIAVFFVQNMSDVYRMAALEARLNEIPAATPAPIEEPPLAAVGLRTVAQIGRLLSGAPAATTLGLRERFQFKEAARSFFDMLEDGPPAFAAEVERLRAKYPDLWLISPLHGLTSRDRLALSQQGKTLLKDLRTALQPGKSTDEK